jgi:hypothetical protein
MMKAFAIPIVALCLAALPGTAPAASAVQLGCTVSGSPYANDVRIANTSGGTLPAGTRIKWTVASPHATGKVTLTDALGAGESVLLAGALIVGPAAGTPCSAVAIL